MIESLKSDFPVLKGNVVYLDSAASTQKPKCVIESVVNHLSNDYANIHRGVYSLSEKSTLKYNEARDKVANFIGANSYRNIVFTRNATESINLVSYTLGREIVKEGDEILLTILEHHANIVPWQMLAKEKNAVLRFVNIDKSTYKLDMDDFKAKLNNNTKIVAFTLASNVTGTIPDAKEIVKSAKKVGAVTLCDGAQFVPHHKINVTDLDMDFMVFSGHKMLAMDGTGVLYGKDTLLNSMSPFLFGGDMIESVTVNETAFAQLPEKFEAGTPFITGAVSLKSAIEYLEKQGMDNVLHYETQLNKLAVSKLEKLGFIDFFIDTNNISNGILSFNIQGVHPHDAATILAENNVCVRAGQHCAAPLIDFLGELAVLRASFYIYNDTKDVEKLIKSVIKAKELFTL
jgi:cysteine desulfurase/selenocysteine lyase